MARRRRARPREEPPEGYAERRGRPARRSRGNEALWLALGAAGVLGVVVLFMLAGGSSGKLEKEEATKAFKELVKALLADDSRRGIALIDEKVGVAAYNPEIYKKWAVVSAAEREATLTDLFRWHRNKLRDELRVKTLRDMEKILDSARIEWLPVQGWVEIRWEFDDEFSSLAHWVVIVKEYPEGGWLVSKFEQQE